MNFSRSQKITSLLPAALHQAHSALAFKARQPHRIVEQLLTRRYVPQNTYTPLNIADKVTGQKGREYVLENVLQDKGFRLGRVYKASSDTGCFVLKEIPQNLQARHDIYRRTISCPHIRKLSDTIPEHQIFVFDYLDQDLLQLAHEDLPITRIKQILKYALLGLAALHKQDIVHSDIKPNNVLVQMKKHAGAVDIEQVLLGDLEDATHLPPGMAINGVQVGNWMWRSPEAHAEGYVDKPSDMFSFGIVCIYALTKAIIFSYDEAKYDKDIEKLAVVLHRQISFFADEEGFDGLMRYLGDRNPWCKGFQVLKDGALGEDRNPIALWEEFSMDADFRDLISGLTNFDPDKRLTAEQALNHRWFEAI